MTFRAVLPRRYLNATPQQHNIYTPQKLNEIYENVK